MKRHLRRTLPIAALALVAVGLLVVGGAAEDQPGNEPDPAVVAATAAPDPDPYPLAEGQTENEIKLLVFERSYSECASYDLAQLGAKYKTADNSRQGVAAAVGRAWASYFKAGLDAAREGRAGCLQGVASR